MKAIIFDWEGTLVQDDVPRPEAEEVLKYCRSKGCRLAVVSAASDSKKRQEIFQNSPLNKYFEIMLASDVRPGQIRDTNYTGKAELMQQVVKRFNLPPEEVLIVDDRVVRGVKYGNQHGHPTVWMKGGWFPDELPNTETGKPTYTIHELRELMSILSSG